MAGPYGYVAYIDEAGDHATKLIANNQRTGVSEWFVISAFVVSAANESKVGAWHRKALQEFGYTQRKDIHFRDLNDRLRRIVCAELAEQPARLFAVMSNKKNMQQYKNLKPIYDADWFYRWMIRLLLERVTLFCHRHANDHPSPARTLKLVFSRNGWIDYKRTREYLVSLREQSKLGMLYLKQGDLQWDVMDLDHFNVVDHANEAGLQFADVVASAFYQGVAIANSRARCEPSYAELLKPRVFAAKGQHLGFGLKTMPALPSMALQPQQRRLFEIFGYPPERW